ncbi:hypothetical protein JR316_0002938 [Psilocybe cubensis]|uniref:Uncharacterized protein n=2 Tax=Psilocybe cubensis TaxID=181762 RepID=A0A8H7Y488_PSICU|nr:hypothetical protein JR316_0002938 [Psilocybe cubensis]KAH9483470.1 hypothetical protein JR316_0002938 [Psilocybe cubensis]
MHRVPASNISTIKSGGDTPDVSEEVLGNNSRIALGNSIEDVSNHRISYEFVLNCLRNNRLPEEVVISLKEIIKQQSGEGNGGSHDARLVNGEQGQSDAPKMAYSVEYSNSQTGNSGVSEDADLSDLVDQHTFTEMVYDNRQQFGIRPDAVSLYGASANTNVNTTENFGYTGSNVSTTHNAPEADLNAQLAQFLTGFSQTGADESFSGWVQPSAFAGLMAPSQYFGTRVGQSLPQNIFAPGALQSQPVIPNVKTPTDPYGWAQTSATAPVTSLPSDYRTVSDVGYSMINGPALLGAGNSGYYGLDTLTSNTANTPSPGAMGNNFTLTNEGAQNQQNQQWDAQPAPIGQNQFGQINSMYPVSIASPLSAARLSTTVARARKLGGDDGLHAMSPVRCANPDTRRGQPVEVQLIAGPSRASFSEFRVPDICDVDSPKTSSPSHSSSPATSSYDTDASLGIREYSDARQRYSGNFMNNRTQNARTPSRKAKKAPSGSQAPEPLHGGAYSAISFVAADTNIRGSYIRNFTKKVITIGVKGIEARNGVPLHQLDTVQLEHSFRALGLNVPAEFFSEFEFPAQEQENQHHADRSSLDPTQFLFADAEGNPGVNMADLCHQKITIRGADDRLFSHGLLKEIRFVITFPGLHFPPKKIKLPNSKRDGFCTRGNLAFQIAAMILDFWVKMAKEPRPNNYQVGTTWVGLQGYWDWGPVSFWDSSHQNGALVRNNRRAGEANILGLGYNEYMCYF